MTDLEAWRIPAPRERLSTDRPWSRTENPVCAWSSSGVLKGSGQLRDVENEQMRDRAANLGRAIARGHSGDLAWRNAAQVSRVPSLRSRIGRSLLERC
jgi:hypothetical protein